MLGGYVVSDPSFVCRQHFKRTEKEHLPHWYMKRHYVCLDISLNYQKTIGFRRRLSSKAPCKQTDTNTRHSLELNDFVHYFFSLRLWPRKHWNNRNKVYLKSLNEAISIQLLRLKLKYISGPTHSKRIQHRSIEIIRKNAIDYQSKSSILIDQFSV